MIKSTYALRAEELEMAIIQACAELDKADGSRIGLQEAIDATQSTLREAYGDSFEEDVSQFLEEEGSNEDDEEEGNEDD